jgi:hypothetical protein
MSGFPYFTEIDIVFLALTALSISTGLLVYLMHNIFIAGGMLSPKSIFIGLSAGLAMFFGVGWIAS